jgi:DNA-directed RNA polymerase subunit RPC12/RpoP
MTDPIKPNDNDDDDVRCPKCGSRKIVAAKTGWSLMFGANNKLMNNCQKCGHKFPLGQG